MQNDTLWAIRCVWLRYFDVYRKNLLYGLTTTFVEPILYFVSFGFGVGAMIGAISFDGHALTYRQFILSGIIAQSIMFQGFFDGAYGGFVRMYYQKIFKAMATTPVTLSEVLWGELLWDASKGLLASSMVLTLGVVLGDFHPWGALAMVPLCFFCSLLFAGFGLLIASRAGTIEDISYPQYLFVFPMFLFCGVYFPLDRLPGWLQTVAWFLPLTSVLSIARTLTLGLPLHWQAIPIVLFWLVFLVWLSRRGMIRRLVK